MTILNAYGRPLNVSSVVRDETPAPAPAPVAQAGTAPNPRPRGVTYADAAPLTVVRQDNPKKPGTKAHDNYARYAGCATVGEYVAAMAEAGEGRGQAMRCLQWDAKRAYITIG